MVQAARSPLRRLEVQPSTVLASYIADFSWRSAMLIVEMGGDTHGMTAGYDARRTAMLEERGWQVLRFSNADVMANIEGVLTTLSAALPSPGFANARHPLP